MTALPGKVVLVTGAAGGIGRRMALLAARRGATVVGWDLNSHGLETLQQEIDGIAPGRGFTYVCDVTNREAVYDLAKRTEAEAGPVDVLILNAGVIKGKLLWELSDSDIEQTFNVNVLGLYWATRAFLPSMRERESGHIVTIASAAGLLGVVRQTDYSASKHAAVGFAESLRVELARYAPQLKTTLVCPYYINTGMFEGVRSRVPWLLPILDEENVSEKIIRSIERDREQIALPPMVGRTPLLRWLPPRAFDRVMDLLGVNKSMDDFRGRMVEGQQVEGQQVEPQPEVRSQQRVS